MNTTGASFLNWVVNRAWGVTLGLLWLGNSSDEGPSTEAGRIKPMRSHHPVKNPILSILFLMLATAPIQADQPGDARDIQGTWIPIKAELAGQTMKQDYLNSFTLSMHGGKYEVAAESLDKGTYTINSAAKPRTVDITGVEGPNAGKKILAIYELSGDTLRVCYGLGGTPRPAEFKSPAGTQTFLVTYKRKKA